MIRRVILTTVFFLVTVPAIGGTTVATTSLVTGAPHATISTAGSVDCMAPAGTQILSFVLNGGNGNPITWSLTGGDTTDFAMSGNILVVGPNGIASANCSKTLNVTVTATQP